MPTVNLLLRPGEDCKLPVDFDNIQEHQHSVEFPDNLSPDSCSATNSDNSKPYPDLIFGLIGAIGSDLAATEELLSRELAKVGYSSQLIKLSDLLRTVQGEPWNSLPPRQSPLFYTKAMDAGNKLREITGRQDAVAALSLAAIRTLRQQSAQNSKRAFIISSLKRPEEVDLLKSVYGSHFVTIATYSPRPARVDRLSMLLAERQHKNQSAETRSNAEALVIRDENERLPSGQDVRKTFPRADLFLDGTLKSLAERDISRFVELFFGQMWHTPTVDEQGMALAYLAKVRSASPARQVGASITTSRGRVLAIGTNEVARAGGGQYWALDADDGRDFRYDKSDSSDRMRRNLLADVLDRLKAVKLLADGCPPMEDLLDPEKHPGTAEMLRDAQIFDSIDYIRAVHAEAAALLSCENHIDHSDSILYVTTFPCHECARHIVISGVKRVVYIEPYPKSLVSELFKDSISVDSESCSGSKVLFKPFVGIAPTLYSTLFEASKKKRKSTDGSITNWIPLSSFPQESIAYSQYALTVPETDAFNEFRLQLEKRNLIKAGV